MDPNYEYDAPRYVDFSDLNQWEQSEVESYFEINHEEGGAPMVDSENPTSAPEQKENPDPVAVEGNKLDQSDGHQPMDVDDPKSLAAAEAAKPARSGRARTRSQASLDDATNSSEASSKSSCSFRSDGGLRRTNSLRSIKKGNPANAKVLTDSVHNKKFLSSEDQELLKMEKLREELAKKRKLAEKSRQQALRPNPVKVVHSTKLPVTKPVDFHFATDERIKSHQLETRTDAKKEEHKSPAPKRPTGPTIPKPFKLHESKKKKTEQGTFVSMAQQLMSYSARTPDRFHTKAGNKPPTPQRKKDPGTKVTIPHTPNLCTRGRTRSAHVESAAEKEEKEVQEMAKSQFKANPVNKNILEKANVGVKKIPAKPPTEPIGFEFESDFRVKPKAVDKSQEEEPSREFRAQPYPEKIFQKTTGLKAKEPAAPTVPESPAFALKKRIRQVVSKNEDEEPVKKVACHQRLHSGIPFYPKLEHQVTEPQPFSFAERDQQRLTRKEQKIREQLEKEKKLAEFHATPLPDLSPDTLPEKRKKPPTKPQPFNLEIDARGSVRSEQWGQKVVQEEMRQQKEAAQFKARPATVVHSEPFVPRKSPRVLLEVNEFELNTDRRAKQRDEWEQHVKSKQQELDAARRQRELENQRREEEEVERLRKEAVHKANQVRHYKPVVIQPSEKPLTEAKTPRFSQRLKSRTATIGKF